MRPWFVYLIECRDGSLYTGIAVDVARRYAMHAAGKGARYTRSRPPVRLLATFEHPDRAAASRAEYAIKQLPAARKRALCATGGAGGATGVTNPGTAVADPGSRRADSATARTGLGTACANPGTACTRSGRAVADPATPVARPATPVARAATPRGLHRPRPAATLHHPARPAAMNPILFELDRDFVELNQLLKLVGLCGSGGEGKMIVASGAVTVDGEVELRKTCKIHAGQRVGLEGVEIRVVDAR